MVRKASNMYHTSSEVTTLVSALLSRPRIPLGYLEPRQGSRMINTLQALTRADIALVTPCRVCNLTDKHRLTRPCPAMVYSAYAQKRKYAVHSSDRYPPPSRRLAESGAARTP